MNWIDTKFAWLKTWKKNPVSPEKAANVHSAEVEGHSRCSNAKQKGVRYFVPVQTIASSAFYQYFSPDFPFPFSRSHILFTNHDNIENFHVAHEPSYKLITTNCQVDMYFIHWKGSL